ncbi:MAG: hypothetical protein RQ875_14580 [Vicingaceae bacterium]|nr:hypothetical protein [Vicingaceae bacterium]
MKEFSELTTNEKIIRNLKYTNETLHKAIETLKKNNSEYIPQIVLEREIKSNEKFIKQLESE